MGKVFGIGLGVLVWAAAAAPAGATVTNASMAFCDSSCIFATGTTGEAGGKVGYYLKFTVPNGFNGATGSITIDASSLAPGTAFPAKSTTSGEVVNYFVYYNSGGYTVLGPVSRSSGNQTVTVTPNNNSLTVPPGGQMALSIGGPISSPPNQPTNPTTAGSNHRFAISTSSDGAGNTNTFTIVPDDPASLTVTAGDGQSTEVGTAFSSPVTARVADQFGNGISGVTVDFGAPASGATGIFADDSVTTDSAGDASTGVTANTVAGLWNGTASTTAGSAPQDAFALTNEPGAADSVALSLQPSSIVGDGASTSTATATAEDEFSNPVPGDTLAFTSSDPSQEISATTDNGDGTYTATITASTTPGDSTITATDSSVVPGEVGTAQLTQTADTSGPTAAIDSGPKGRTERKRAKFEFSAPESDLGGFECRLDKGDWEACASPAEYSVKKGKHKFSVRATDLAGNTGPAAKRKFKRV